MRHVMKIIVGFWFFLLALFLYNVTTVHAGGVTDTNNANKGDILVATGENNGANTVGEWKDSSFLKGEKGDKGDKGDTGAAGQQGEAGKAGENGTNGKDGKNGAKGNQGERGYEGKGLEDRYELEYEGVIKSWKRVEVSVSAGYDFNNEINIFRGKVKHYWGESWTEKQLRLTNERIDRLEKNYFERDNMEIVETETGYSVQPKN